MKKQKLLWIWALIMLIPGFLRAEIAEQLATAQPGQFLEEWMVQHNYPKDILVLLDLDDTAITSPKRQLMGRSDTFYHLLKEEQKLHPEKSKVEVAESIDPLLIPIYFRVPVVPTDERLPEVLKSLKSRNIKVIGMTARGRTLDGVTKDQLERAGIEFADLGPDRKFYLDEKRYIRIIDGVVMVSHGNKKGESLVALIKAGILKKPAQVMLVDDRQRHLDDMAQALKGFDPSIRFNPVLCTFLDTQPEFDPQAANDELIAFLHKSRNDPEISSLIKTDPYTHKVIDQCKSLTKRNQRYCDVLSQMMQSP